MRDLGATMGRGQCWLGMAGLGLLVALGPAACNGEVDDADGEGASAGAPNETGGSESGSGGDPGEGSGGTVDITGGTGGRTDSTGGLGGMGGLGEGGMAGGPSEPECDDDEERTIDCGSDAIDATQAQHCVDGSWRNDGYCTCAGTSAEYDPHLAVCLEPIACDEYARPFGGGSGTEQDPFVLCSFAQLDAVRGALDRHFVLARSLDLSAVSDFVPIGSDAAPFVGVFDGSGRVLVGLEVHLDSGAHRAGLFAVVGDTNAPATVRDLQLRGFAVAAARYAGALAGEVRDAASLVEGVLVQGGQVSGGTRVGGLTGRSAGTVRGCSASANVDGSDAGGLVGVSNGAVEGSSASGTVGVHNEVWDVNVGGLVGLLSGGRVTSSSASGDVFGRENIGGLVGGNTEGTVEDSFASGHVGDFDGDAVGGLVGANGGTISRSRAVGSVSGWRWVGGLVGRQDFGSVDNSYATGEVGSDDEYTGGLVGFLEGVTTVTNSYAVGQVYGETWVGSLVGGAAATATVTVSSSYCADGDGYGTYLSQEDFALEASFVDWDFDSTWVLSTALGRPVLQWE